MTITENIKKMGSICAIFSNAKMQMSLYSLTVVYFNSNKLHDKQNTILIFFLSKRYEQAIVTN